MPYFAIINLRTVVTFSIDSGVTSVRRYINSMRRRWNSSAIKRMREQLKPGPSSSSGLGTRLGVGWMPVWCRHQFETIKLWFCHATIDECRLTRKIFKWSLELVNKSKPTSGWCFHANKLLTQINLGHLNPDIVTSLSPEEFQVIVH